MKLLKLLLLIGNYYFFSNVCYHPLFYNSGLACEDRCCKTVPMSSFKSGITTVTDLIDLDKKCYISTDVS